MLRPEGHPYVAATLDWAMRPLAKIRRRLLPQARGRVLEIGAGTGLNLAFYEGIDAWTGVEPDPHMRERAQPRLAQAPFPTELLADGAEALPFEDGVFDTVVATWVLCTIPDPESAARELRRVVKDDGLLIFAEHTRAPCAVTHGVQRAIDPVWKRFAGGCHLSRDAVGMLEEAGFALEVWAPKRPCLTVVPQYRGTGRPGGVDR